MKCILENQTHLSLFPNIHIFYSVFVPILLFSKNSLWQSDAVQSFPAFPPLTNSSFFQLACVCLFANLSHLRNCSPKLIKLPPDQALLLFIGRSVVSERVCTVNITEPILAWPHQYNMDRGPVVHPCFAPHPSHVGSDKTYSEENWLCVYSDDHCLHLIYRKYFPKPCLDMLMPWQQK